MTPILKPLPDELPPQVAQQLDHNLGVLRAGAAALAPAPAIEARLQAALRRKTRRGAFAWLDHTGYGRFGVPAAALALSLAFAGWVGLGPVLAPMGKAIPLQVSAQDSDQPFIALQSAERIALESSATIVSTTFPRAMLAQYGLPVAPERAGDAVRADMLVASNGQPLALRIIE